MTPMMLLLIAAGAGLIAGVVLVAVGLRGRRLDDHPVCRRCGFDLIGVWPGAEVCSECGRGLAGKRRVRRGNRVRRRRVAAVGAVMLLAGAAGLAFAGQQSAKGVNWNKVKPVWLLRWEATGEDPFAAAAALEELAMRVSAERIGERGSRRLGILALERQEEELLWLPEWAPLFEAAYVRGAMADEEFGEYAARAVDTQISTRKTARAGSALMFSMHTGRTGVGSGATLRIQYLNIRVLVNGEEVIHPGALGGTAFKGTWSGGSVGMQLPQMPEEPGPCEVVAEILLGFHPDTEIHEEYVAKRTVRCRHVVQLVGPEVELVKVKDDASQLALMARKTKVKVFDVTRYGESFHARLQYWLEEGTPPVAYDVFFRSNGREWAADGFTAGAGPTGTARYAELPSDFDADVVDVIFRSSVPRAEQSSMLDEILGGEFVIEDVAVEWRKP